MVSENGPQRKKQLIYKAILISLIGLAMISSARKDLKQFMALANDVQNLADRLFGDVLPSAQARTLAPPTNSAGNERAEAVEDNDFHWAGRVEPGKSIEIKGISGDIQAEPAGGNQVEVVAHKTARRGDADAVKIQFVEHAGGITICAIYPSEDPDRVNTCEPGSSSRNTSNGGNRHTDVAVNFTVRVPAGVAFIGRTVNGGISAASLASNVFTHTVNGSIRISTSGYAEAKTVNGEIVASLGNGNWPSALEFKTVNGGITLDLPSGLSTRVTADTFNGEVTSDFPLNVEGAISRKHLSGTIGGGGRELLLKTLNGSINLRRAS